MVDILYSVKFIRTYKKLDSDLRIEVEEKIELFKDSKNHASLKVHKLSGKLKGKYSFSIDYKNRIIFKYTKTKKEAVLLVVGNHDLYK